MKSKNDTTAGSKKDRVYAVNDKQPDAGKQRGHADTQQHARQDHDQQSRQQGAGQTSIGQSDGRNAGRDGQQHARQDDGNRQQGGNPSGSKSNQQGNHSDDRPRGQDKPQQR